MTQSWEIVAYFRSGTEERYRSMVRCSDGWHAGESDEGELLGESFEEAMAKLIAKENRLSN